jgi:ribose/xylose/arabinose/galactoside ABC-type transport system permease subunit
MRQPKLRKALAEHELVGGNCQLAEVIVFSVCGLLTGLGGLFISAQLQVADVGE